MTEADGNRLLYLWYICGCVCVWITSEKSSNIMINRVMELSWAIFFLSLLNIHCENVFHPAIFEITAFKKIKHDFFHYRTCFSRCNQSPKNIGAHPRLWLHKVQQNPIALVQLQKTIQKPTSARGRILIQVMMMFWIISSLPLICLTPALKLLIWPDQCSSTIWVLLWWARHCWMGSRRWPWWSIWWLDRCHNIDVWQQWGYTQVIWLKYAKEVEIVKPVNQSNVCPFCDTAEKWRCNMASSAQRSYVDRPMFSFVIFSVFFII